MTGKKLLPIVLLTISTVLSGQPTGNLTGGGIICPGDSTALQINFTGTPPWSIDYTYNINQQTYHVTNIESTPYTFYAHDAGVYELISISDINSEGIASGSAIVSAYTVPTAVISGSRQICPGSSSTIPISLTGTAPWTISVLLNGNAFSTVDEITGSPYQLPITLVGNYTISTVTDANCKNSGTGNYSISNYTVPTGVITGTQQLCQDQQGALTVVLAGQAPWTFTVLRNGIVYQSGITTSSGTYQLPVTTGGTYTLSNLTDLRCSGTTSGSAVVTVNSLPVVEILSLNPVYSVSGDPVVLAGNPSGGVFSGPGVVSATSTFYPAIAGVNGSPHSIVYRYTQPATGCSNSDTARVSIIAAYADIFFAPEKTVYCSNDEPVTITGINAAGSVGYFTINGNTGLQDNGDNTATLTPSVLANGIYTISYTYFNSIWLTVSRQIETERISNPSVFGFSKQSFCKNEPNFIISGSPSGGTFSGSGVLAGQGNFYYSPAMATAGADTVSYTFSTAKGCQATTQKVLATFTVPVPQFAQADSCITPTNPLPVRFVNQTQSDDEVVQWLWNFGDPSSGENNTSTSFEPDHVYLTSGDRLVSLTATTSEQCSASANRTIKIFHYPVVNFYNRNECVCDDAPNQFIDASSPDLAGNSYQWSIKGPSDTLVLYSRDALPFLASAGNYLVSHSVTTAEGCRSNTTKPYLIKPTYSLADSFYLENFESEASWSAQSTTPANSWVLDTLVLPGATNFGTAWHMHEVGNQVQQSWVKSPCFNFDEVEKPFMLIDIFRRFDNRRDGAVMEYTTNGGESWQVLGTIDDGVNWYDWYNIFGQPGGQALGWAATTDQNWVTARHDLDVLADEQLVQFRVSYGSDGTAYYSKGFAFDNFRVGTRNKKLFVEHFTNAQSDVSRDADELIAEISNNLSQDMVTVTYHTPYGGTDSIYLSNPMGLFAKLVENSVEQAPWSLVDGAMAADWATRFPSENDLRLKTLDISPFEIEWEISATDPLQGHVIVRALTAIDSADLAIPVLVIEPRISTTAGEFYQVVRKHLSDGPVWFTNRRWNPGDTAHIALDQTPDIEMFSDSYALVCYIQNPDTREIFQSSVSEAFAAPAQADKQGTTSNVADKFVISPNPGTDAITLTGTESDSECQIHFINSYGQTVYATTAITGEPFDISSLASGVYYLRITSPKGVYYRSFICK